ncbi:hypothetical protein DFH06DRAFT_1344232 [Mycena polygramma]|nr:hypothetical protein DFH06DRAFT_1344232 [Mycena polygramma]
MHAARLIAFVLASVAAAAVVDKTTQDSVTAAAALPVDAVTVLPVEAVEPPSNFSNADALVCRDGDYVTLCHELQYTNCYSWYFAQDLCMSIPYRFVKALSSIKIPPGWYCNIYHGHDADTARLSPRRLVHPRLPQRLQDTHRKATLRVPRTHAPPLILMQAWVSMRVMLAARIHTNSYTKAASSRGFSFLDAAAPDCAVAGTLVLVLRADAAVQTRLQRAHGRGCNLDSSCTFVTATPTRRPPAPTRAYTPLPTAVCGAELSVCSTLGHAAAALLL